jgi:preprotein translocase subunit YajC
MTGISSILPQLLAAPDASGGTAAGGGGSLITMLVTFGLIIVVFYFLVIRPQNKKQKDAKKMLESIRKGDRVQTIGGMHGTVESVKDDAVILRVDENVKIRFAKSAVATVLERKEEPAETKE